MGQLFVSLQNTQTKLTCKMARIVASVALLACSTLSAPQFQGDSSNARILQEQRFNAGAGKFGSAFAQEDGVVYREESGGNNERIGQYSYIGDDGKTYTVKYSAGVNGFRIIGGDHIPSGGQTSAQNQNVNAAGEIKEYDYEYYDDTKPSSPFVNPHDPSHPQKDLTSTSSPPNKSPPTIQLPSAIHVFYLLCKLIHKIFIATFPIIQRCKDQAIQPM